MTNKALFSGNVDRYKSRFSYSPAVPTDLVKCGIELVIPAQNCRYFAFYVRR